MDFDKDFRLNPLRHKLTVDEIMASADSIGRMLALNTIHDQAIRSQTLPDLEEILSIVGDETQAKRLLEELAAKLKSGETATLIPEKPLANQE